MNKSGQQQKYNFLIYLLLLLSTTDYAVERVDTSRVYRLDEITISEHYRNTEIRSSAPAQILSASQISRLQVLQLSDAVKYFSGVNVRDYGGVGGLKTISVRSLGASHTAVSYDGIVLSDCQTGQINIGQFSLDQVETVSLQTGQGDNIFQPARMFASASLLNIKTISPVFQGKDKLMGKIVLKGGSFGLFNPAVQLHAKLNPQLTGSLSGELQTTKGNYPYLLTYGSVPGSLNTTEIRKNSDVLNIRLEGSLFYIPGEKQKISVKGYFYNSARGVPGATILYNEDAFTSQRMHENLIFVQSHYENQRSDKWNYQLNIRYQNSNMQYVDSAVLNDAGYEDSRYRQQEWYATGALLYRLSNNLSFDASSDVFLNNMQAEFENTALTESFAQPLRFTWLNVIAAKYISESITGTASILSTTVNEFVQSGQSGHDYQRFSPYVSLIYKPFNSEDLRFRIFYKDIFRLPSFNDLYFLRVGNTALKPETTRQINLGITYSIKPQSFISLLSVTADIYRNHVKDKIVALPAKNIMIWSMVNLGEVQVDGLDLTVETAIPIHEKIMLTAGGNYSYQKALDVTNPWNSTWMHQIPYTPRISGSGKAGIETPWVNVFYSVLWSGKRYAGYQNYSENRLPGYADHSISFSRDFQLIKQHLHVSLEVNNLLNKQYEIVKWYPMPGRSFRLTGVWMF